MLQKTILIVEDETQLRKALVKRFSAEGFQTIEAKDGAAGLRLALTAHPDLILLDLLMPVMDGMTMLKKLRLDAWGKKATIIILTNLGDTKEVARALAAGAYDYLVKADWQLEKMVKKVREKLGV